MFTGRIGVRDYWWSILCLTLALMAATGLLAVTYFTLVSNVFRASNAGLGTLITTFIVGIILIAIPSVIAIVYSIGLQVRRLHDMGYSGWLVLLFWVIGWIPGILKPAILETNSAPIIDPVGMSIALALMLAFIVFISLPGTKGPNAYGEPVRYANVTRMITGNKSGEISETAHTASGIAYLIGAVALVLVIIGFYAASKM